MKILILSVIAGILYRLGGIGGAWWKNTKVRDIGVPIVSLALLWSTAPWWIWGLCGIWMFGAMTTYCKLGREIDVYWYSWLLTGLHYGVCMLPYAWYSGNWLGFGIRAVLLGIVIMIWSEKISDDTLEEFGRGFLNTATMPLLLLK